MSGGQMNGGVQQPQAVLRAILESPKDIVIFALDREYRYLAFNQNHAHTIKHIWGVDIHVGDQMLNVIGRDDDREKARRNFDRALAGESFTLQEEYGDERMQRRIYEDVYSPIRAEDAAVIGLTVYLTDITEQRRAEIELENHRSRLEDLVRQRTKELESAHAQLLYAQKLESLGVLAGGVAHDFNNLLAVILARAELGLPSLPADHVSRAHFEIIRETALEARMLTKQLLAYSGKGRFMIQAVNLTEMIESMATLLRASIRKSITLAFESCGLPLVVQLDVTQARQVVLNLVSNAAEAIDGPGQVTVRTRSLEVDEQLLGEACIQSDVGPGCYASIEVEDSGCGMDREVRTKLFDPFFTTKVAGRGFGLAAVLGIVKSHHGTVLLRTAPNKGSKFSVLFPIASGVATPLAKASTPAQSSFRGESIALVVDDEDPVRQVTAEMLASLGYEVMQAQDGRRAAELLSQHGERIRIVLLDLTMPGMSGEQTLRALKAVRPAVKVIVLTGYAEDEARLRFVQGELAGFLTKPFIRDELIEVLQSAMKKPDS
jgi:two-component system, cell cycle sensor histidine kinase and response regulator CckA